MKKTGLFLFFAILLFSTSGSAQNNKLAGGVAVIKVGAASEISPNPDYRGWSELRSFVHQKAGAGQRTDSIRFEAEKDNSTAVLAEAFRNKTVLPRVEIHAFVSKYDDGSVAYDKYELINVIVTSYSVVDELQGIVVLCRLNYREIKVTRNEKDASGSMKSNVRYTWNAGDGGSP